MPNEPYDSDNRPESQICSNQARQQDFCFVSGHNFSRAVKAKRVGLKSLRENYALPISPVGRADQDVVLGNDKQAGQSREGRLNTGAEFQSSLRD
jgi:hypothetical protein